MHYTHNITNVESSLPDTAIFCTKEYNAEMRFDVYNLVKKGNITDNGRADGNCQRYIDGLRSSFLNIITFTFKFMGEERPLGCFYQLQGEDDIYYTGHGKSWSLMGNHVCDHSNVEPSVISLSTSPGPPIDIQLSTVVLSVGFVVLILAVLLLACGYCQIQKARKLKLAGRIENLPTYYVPQFPRYGVPKCASEDLHRRKSTPQLLACRSLPTQQIQRGISSRISKPSVFDQTRLHHLTPPFMPSCRTSREWFSALNAAHRGNPRASTPTRLPTVRATNGESVRSRLPGKPVVVNGSRVKSHADFTQTTSAETTGEKSIYSLKRGAGKESLIRLSKSPQKVQSAVGSVRTPPVRSPTFDTRGRTVSLPSVYEKMARGCSLNCSADAVWNKVQDGAAVKNTNDVQLHGSTYMITADNMFEFLRAQQQARNKKINASTATVNNEKMNDRPSMARSEFLTRSAAKTTILVSPEGNDGEAGMTLTRDRSVDGETLTMDRSMLSSNFRSQISAGLMDAEQQTSEILGGDRCPVDEGDRFPIGSSSSTTVVDFHEYLGLLKRNIGSKPASHKQINQPSRRQLQMLAKMAVIFSRVQDDCHSAATKDTERKFCSNLSLTKENITALRDATQETRAGKSALAPGVTQSLAFKPQSTDKDGIAKYSDAITKVLNSSIKKKRLNMHKRASASDSDGHGIRHGETGLEVKKIVSEDERPSDRVIRISSCHRLVAAKSKSPVGRVRSHHMSNVVAFAPSPTEERSRSLVNLRPSAASANIMDLSPSRPAA